MAIDYKGDFFVVRTAHETQPIPKKYEFESIQIAPPKSLIYNCIVCGDVVHASFSYGTTHKILVHCDPMTGHPVFVTNDTVPIPHLYQLLHGKVKFVLLDVDGDGMIDTLLQADDVSFAVKRAKADGLAVVTAALGSTFVDVSDLATSCALVASEWGGCAQAVVKSVNGQRKLLMLQSSAGWSYVLLPDPRELMFAMNSGKRVHKHLRGFHWTSLPAARWIYEGELTEEGLFDVIEHDNFKIIESLRDRDTRRSEQLQLHEKHLAIDPEEARKEAERRAAIAAQRTVKQSEAAKPFSSKGASHTPKKKSGKPSSWPQDRDKRRGEKAEKIEAARRHENDKKEREADAMRQLEERERMLAIGDAIQHASD